MIRPGCVAVPCPGQQEVASQEEEDSSHDENRGTNGVDQIQRRSNDSCLREQKPTRSGRTGKNVPRVHATLVSGPQQRRNRRRACHDSSTSES